MNRSLICQARRGLALFSLVLLSLGCSLAHGSSFSVNPVRVTLSAKQPVAAITVRNTGPEPAVIQLETSAWSQEQGKDALTPSSDLLATPPIFTVPAGGTQIVRVGLRGVRESSAEITYRLVLREVPPSRPLQMGLRVALMISMPIFVVPAKPIAAALKWRAMRAPDGKLRVSATNTGNSHVQLAKLEVAAGSPIANRDIAEYVLPGNTRSWTVDAKSIPSAGAKLHIFATSDAGEFESDVVLEADSAISVGAAPIAPAAR